MYDPTTARDHDDDEDAQDEEVQEEQRDAFDRGDFEYVSVGELVEADVMAVEDGF